MGVKVIWFSSAVIVSVLLWFIFQLHLIVGWFIGLFIGFIITTTIKLMKFSFDRTESYTKRGSSCYDDYDSYDTYED